jgi:hypothetical protein
MTYLHFIHLSPMSYFCTYLGPGSTGRGLSDPTKGMCASTQLSPAQLAAPQHFHLPLEGYILYALVVDLLVILLAIPGPHKP